MSIPANRTESAASPVTAGNPQAVGRILPFVGLWLVGTVIAVFFATIQADSAVVGDMYVPRTNDSFYHAWRILDAALGDHGLAQFDERLNPPAGTLIPWPWAYDYLMAGFLRLALAVDPALNPMALLSYVPVAWIGVNAALFVGATGALGLSLPLRSIAVLAFALSPLTQMLHSVAMLDHHFIELTFVLASTWLGMAWLSRPASLARAISLGVLLGAAPAFHVGLFLLLLIPLASIVVLWLRGTAPPFRALTAFGAALVAVTLLILLPSEPFRRGLFEFTLLSWFHLYVSCATAAIAVLVGYWGQSNRRRVAALAGVMLVLGLPLLTNVLAGAAFVTGQVSILPDIAEAKSPFRFDGETLASSEGISYYSWLLLLVPLLFGYFAWRSATETAPPRLYFAISAVLGLAMLSLQLRFHYYGSFAMLAGSVLVLDDLGRRRGWHAGVAFVGALLALTLAYQPPLRERLFTIYAAGADPDYEHSLGIMLKLGEVCAERPGLVLANNDDGSAILFHSDCSVIANNFILGNEDDAKFARIANLMRGSTGELLSAEPPIRYLFIRADDFGRTVDESFVFDRSAPIVTELFLAPTPPPGFELLHSIDVRRAPGAEPEPFLRLYELVPAAVHR